jgi:hypothetical protein
MAETFKIKRGATSPSLVYRVTALSAPGATAIFRMQDAGTKEVYITAGNTTLTVDGDDLLFQYDWGDGETDMGGEFEAEFVLTYAGGATEKLPNEDFINIIIGEDV